MTRYEYIQGCLLGTAVGDALGLPREGLSRQRAERLFGARPLHHAMLAGRGLCSDDTEHTVMLAQAYLVSGGSPEQFQREFARRLRWWLTHLPAGVGLATLRACLKLWCGYSPANSGVWSAGNGPAMRAALLGIFASSDEQLASLVKAATRITHIDPRAEQGSLILAVIARMLVVANGQRLEEPEVSKRILQLASDAALHRNLVTALDVAAAKRSGEDLLNELGFGNGVSGFVVHTVPAVVYCWFVHQGDFRRTVETAVCLGGDSDTVGAIAGALAGAQLGVDAIPDEWLSGLADWPCTVAWMNELATALNAVEHAQPIKKVPSLSTGLLLIRNMAFLLLVLSHGFRRLFPPY